MAKDGYLDTRNGNEISESFIRGLKQKLYYAPKQRKMELLNFVLRKRVSGKVIVFRRTTFGAEKVLKTLLKGGLKAVCIHSEKSKEEQKEALKKFESDEANFLVLTDVSLEHFSSKCKAEMVINFDLPTSASAYLDRHLLMVGKGNSVTFCSLEEKKTVRKIEEIIDKRILVEKNHEFNDDPEEFLAGIRRSEGEGRKSRKSSSSKKKKKRWY